MNITVFIIIGIMLLLGLAYKRGLFNKKDEANTVAPFVVQFPCKLNGRVDAPPQERRIANRDELLKVKKINTTGMTEDQKNKATGGGGVDGGVYLTGAFALIADATGNLTGEFILHGTKLKATGTLLPNGIFNGHANGAFSGRITTDGVVGEILGGRHEEYHNGLMVGTYTV